MRRTIKIVILYILWALGLFTICRYLTRNGLRILCYHGGSIQDEHRFMPGVFMQHRTLRQRLAYLKRAGYPVLGLGEAIERLAKRTLPASAVVITIDDGFFSTFRDAYPLLQEHQFPATIYVASYHVEKMTPVFRLMVQYMFWKTKVNELNCAGLGILAADVQTLETAQDKSHICWEIINRAESQLTDVQRCDLARSLGRQLGVDYDSLVASRCFHLMTADEIRQFACAGIDIQLHTHRHRFPVIRDSVNREIADNRASLAPLVTNPLEHFCYPSGLWSQEHWAWLAALDVVSATTCDPGLNYPETPRLALNRFLDADEISSIEFAAELSGVSEFLRRLRTHLTSGRANRAQASAIASPLVQQHAVPP